jgi:hypothetical protein
MHVWPAVLLLPALLSSPSHAAVAHMAVQPEDTWKFGIEILGYWGFGFRGGYSLDHPVIDAVNLRVGGTLPFRYKEGLAWRHGVVPYDLGGNPGPLTPYLASAVDLNLWGPLELELTGGLALIHVAWDDDLYRGFTAGAALRLDFEADVPVTFNAGALVQTDACWCAPRVALDIGPRFTW